MKSILILWLTFFSLGLILPSCGESKAEREARIERERQAEEARIERERQAEWDASLVGQGWYFLKSKLKRPQTAELLVSADPEQDFCKDYTALASNSVRGVSHSAFYTVKAQNSYGDYTQEIYVVLFKNGQPKCVMTESTARNPMSFAEAVLAAGFEPNN